MLFFNFNGKVKEKGSLVAGPDSRALRYGDGVFETFKFLSGKLLFADAHFFRLWKGMAVLKFDIPQLFSPEQFSKEISELAKKNKITSARVRLGIYRGAGGLYDCASHRPDYVIETYPLNPQALNTNGLELCVYEGMRKPQDPFSNLKHNNFLIYIMAALHAKEQKCNDALVLNTSGTVADSTIANLFIVKDNVICTPPLKDGCVAGTIRQFLLKALPELGYKVLEQSLSVEDILQADECFLTNAVYDLRWVGSLGDKKYGNTVVAQIYRSLLPEMEWKI